MASIRSIALLCGTILAASAFAQTRPATRAGGANERVARGELVSADEQTLVVAVRTPAGEREIKTIDLTAEANVLVNIDLMPATLADLKPGLAVDVQRTPAPRKGLRIFGQSPSVSGTLAAIDGKTLTLIPNRADGQKAEPLIVQTDEATKVIIFRPPAGQPRAAVGELATLADLKVGQQLMVRPPTGVAKSIVVMPLRQPATRPAS